MATDKTTYRFKLSSDIIDELSYFAKLHEFDSKNDYKDAWKEWIKGKTDEIIREKNRLEALGYNGNVEKKLYISARYYYKNKKSTETKPKQRRNYLSCDHELISLMDNFIKSNPIKPSDSYNTFIKENKKSVVLSRQIHEFTNEHSLSIEEITDKLKKTFKNRYYLYNK